VSFRGEGHRRGQLDGGTGAAEVDEGDQGAGAVEAAAAVADQADRAVHAFKAAVGQAEAKGGEDAGAVGSQGAREPDGRRQA
jgi:hypothetical protein